MPENTIEIWRKIYFRLSSRLAQLNDAQLRSLYDRTESGIDFRRNHSIDLEPFKVFVKHLPITDIEYENLFSTKNLYNLPTSCNYGVGSLGVSVFREILTHIKTTHWLLEGEVSTFPLMYHYRIMPFSGQRTAVDRDRLESYVEYWGGNENVGRYMLDKANASYELVLFLEHMPYVLAPWLRKNPDKLKQSLDDLRTTIAFLQSKGIIHFDAHFHNALTDGEHTYLTDFGLVLDKSFDLTAEEHIFFEQNTFYDYREILRNLGHLIRWPYEACSESNKCKIMKKYGIEEGLKPHESQAILLDNIEQLQADGLMNLDDFYINSIVKYRSLITLMQDFFAGMCTNDKKDTKLRHAELQRLLTETGFLSDAEFYRK